MTGAAGFVGRHLVPALLGSGMEVHAAVRGTMTRVDGPLVRAPTWFGVGDLCGDTDWSAALVGCDAVVHLAARAHRFDEVDSDGEREMHRINVEATQRLAEQSVAVGVRRFVFVSTIGVMGESSRRPLTETDPMVPSSAYARSKAQAEETLWQIARESGMALVVLRPALVYGPENPGNLARLLGLIGRGWPLPLGSVRNARSLLAVGYLVESIRRALESPAAANQIFLVADGTDVSTPEMISALALGMRRRDPLFRFPPGLLGVIATLGGRRREFEKLAGSLQVDPRKLQERLELAPNRAVLDQLRDVGAWYARQGVRER